MTARLLASFAGAALLALCIVGASRAAPAGDEVDGGQLLREAFTNQYEVDTTAHVELVIRNRAGQERRRHFDAASGILDDRLRSLGRLTYPDHLRGMTLLQLETEQRRHDAFVYLPSMHSVRRVSTAQRGDSFFGTDVTYEDLERRHPQDYQATRVWRERVDGEASFVVAALPRRPRSYAELHFWIAASDKAILQVHFFKRGSPEPFRTISAPRGSMLVSGGHTLPTRIRVENHARGTTTEVRYHDLQVNPKIDRRAFSLHTLERGGRIPGAEERRGPLADDW